MSNLNGITPRITGLASYLDTDAIVSDLMRISRMKVEAVEQQKTILEWKKELYQGITTKLYDFQKKYFDDTTWLNQIQNLSASYNSDYISVSTSSGSVSGSIYIDDIISLASSARLVGSSPVSSDPTIDILTDSLGELSGKSIVLNLNGTEKALTFTDKSYVTSEDVRMELQALINSSFGDDIVAVNLDGNRMTISAENSTVIIKSPGDGTEPAALIFDSFASNRVDMNVSIASADLAVSPLDGENIEFAINGKIFNFTSENTLNDIITAVNESDAGVKMSYSTLTDKFTLTSVDSGSASDVSISDNIGNLMSSLFGTGIKTSGTDAVIRLSTTGSTDPTDFITVTRSTNMFVVDGTTISIKDKANDDALEGIRITLDYDNQAIIDNIKSFLDDYNGLLSSITEKLTEEYDRNYPPLTASQKSDMSEKDIEIWTEKARTGLLRNDIYLKSIETELRSCFYNQVVKLGDNSSPLGILHEIGISTTNYADRGRLTVNESRLREALNQDPEKVISLFSQKSDKEYSAYATEAWQKERFNESGLFYRLSDILSKNLNKIGAKKGALINLVGSPTDIFTGETEYSRRIKAIEDRISVLEDKLIAEENQYWKKFTAMEKALSILNEQSAWIANMMGSNK